MTKQDTNLSLEHRIVNRYRILSDKEWGYIINSHSRYLGDFIYNRILLSPTPQSNLDNCSLSAEELFENIKFYISKLIIDKGASYTGLVYIDSGTDLPEGELSVTDIFRHITTRVYFSNPDDKSSFIADWNSEHKGYDFFTESNCASSSSLKLVSD